MLNKGRFVDNPSQIKNLTKLTFQKATVFTDAAGCFSCKHSMVFWKSESKSNDIARHLQNKY